MKSNMIAVDLGASSCRIIVASKVNDSIIFDEVHRFKNYLVKEDNFLFWDFDLILSQIKVGIKKAIDKYEKITSIGIDAFGVDFGLLDENNKLIQKPYSYRNNLGLKVNKYVDSKIGIKELYKNTGIQYMSFNTIYQLAYINQKTNIKYSKVVLIPDLIAYFLTNELRTEITNFSTTNLMDAFSYEMISDAKKIGIDKNIFPKMINPGEKYGKITDEIKNELAISYDIDVVATCSHDTASAIVSIPKKRSQLFLSSGTWSLLGTVLSNPVITKKSEKYNFSNELGFEKSVRFLKNIMGLWILNNVIEEYKKENGDISIKCIHEMLMNVKPFKTYIDVDDELFTAPISMIESIKEYALKTNQEIPVGIGELVMCIYQSLAFKYRYNISQIEEVTKRHYKFISLVGGGSNIDILNQMIASSTKKIIEVGSSESTVLGNTMIQMKSNGLIKDLKEGFKLLYKEKVLTYLPNQVEDYEEAYQNYIKIIRG